MNKVNLEEHCASTKCGSHGIHNSVENQREDFKNLA